MSTSVERLQKKGIESEAASSVERVGGGGGAGVLKRNYRRRREWANASGLPNADYQCMCVNRKFGRGNASWCALLARSDLTCPFSRCAYASVCLLPVTPPRVPPPYDRLSSHFCDVRSLCVPNSERCPSFSYVSFLNSPPPHSASFLFHDKKTPCAACRRHVGASPVVAHYSRMISSATVFRNPSVRRILAVDLRLLMNDTPSS